MINPTAEMDNALSTPCPSEECDCDDCVEGRELIDLNEGFFSSEAWAPGQKPIEEPTNLEGDAAYELAKENMYRRFRRENEMADDDYERRRDEEEA